GHACETADCGEEALRLVRENDYDLILLDVMLPDIDGYEVLKRIQGWGIETPVMIQSGLVGNEKDRAALGMADSLVKPYGSKELKQRIDAIAEREAPDDAEAGETGGARPRSNGDRRGSLRTRTIKSGLIVFHQNQCDMDCLVLSLSDDGAALQPTDSLNIPDNFVLKIKDGTVHQCRVCWRHGNKLGVRFVDA
ncbi:MAG: response regulator, partial [Kiloniellales bacterium]|nr:response regulator [Kiloniellales bacterium]